MNMVAKYASLNGKWENKKSQNEVIDANT